MTCAKAQHLRTAYFDSELDLDGSLKMEQHVSECPTCAAMLKDLELLQEELTPGLVSFADEADLKSLRASIRSLTRSRSAWRTGWTGSILFATAAAALVLAVFVPVRMSNINSNSGREVVDSHVRSLMENHLVDVPSTDQHTVKPWFQGKVDFSPDVLDLAAQGYALVGGRLDVIAGRPAAAIVYKRPGHFVNLWVSRSEGKQEAPMFTTVNGYHVVYWRTSGMERWAVSDLNQAEIRTFVDLVRSR